MAKRPYTVKYRKTRKVRVPPREPVPQAPRPAPNVVHLNRGYRWRDQDPVVEELCNMIDKSGVKPYQIPQIIARISGGGASMSESTIYNLLRGKTRRPHNFTVEWIAAACGWKRPWVRI